MAECLHYQFVTLALTAFSIVFTYSQIRSPSHFNLIVVVTLMWNLMKWHSMKRRREQHNSPVECKPPGRSTWRKSQRLVNRRSPIHECDSAISSAGSINASYSLLSKQLQALSTPFLCCPGSIKFTQAAGDKMPSNRWLAKRQAGTPALQITDTYFPATSNINSKLKACKSLIYQAMLQHHEIKR